MQDIKTAIPATFGLIFALALSGCGNKEEGAEANSLAKVAASVNGQAILAAQVDAELARVGQVPPDQAQNIANRILQNVVDQELLAQKAVAAKLDGQADVQMKIAAARRQILAEAQIAALTANAGNPGEADVKAYFDGHPELFSKRASYRLQELIVGSNPGNIEAVRQIAAKAANPRELAAALQAKGIPVGVREVVKNAEDLPSELLGKLSGMTKGQSISLEKNGQFNLVILAGLESRPVTLEQATPMITRYLANKAKRDSAEVELKKIRAEAKIEYKPPYGASVDMENGLARP